MGDDKAGFAARLRTAMRDKGWEDRPRELVDRFNSRYRGRSVTFQTVSAWLRGASRPRDDKLVALAQLLGVTPEYLLFGQARVRGVREPAAEWPPAANAHDRAAVTDFLALPADERRVVRDIIATLTRALAGR